MESWQVKTCSKLSGKTKEAKEKSESFVLTERAGTNCHAIKVGFWYQLWATDKPRFLRGIIVDRIRKKVEKCKLDIKFLTSCQDGYLYQTFKKVKHFKDMERKHRNRYQRRFLLNKIPNKQNHLKQLNKHFDYNTDILNKKVTWMKDFADTYSIDIVMNTYASKVEATHEKKFNNLCLND